MSSSCHSRLDGGQEGGLGRDASPSQIEGMDLCWAAGTLCSSSPWLVVSLGWLLGLQAAAADALHAASGGEVVASMAPRGSVAAWIYGNNLVDR